jgi:signal transduction histidine kinase
MVFTEKKTPLSLKSLPVKIIMPVMLTIILFILTIFIIIIPRLEKSMMDGKRESILQLTQTAWSTLNLFHTRAQNGLISNDEARQQAIKHLQKLRYGSEKEDYFWINDMSPKMIMHPYRPDLEGKDVSTFTDPAGKKMFVEMVNTVKKSQAGFVDYLWQWKGDSSKIVPKISYVMEFAPWDWIVGTGIYVEDVRQEILTITHRLIFTCSGIMLLFLILSWYIVLQGTKVQKERVKAMEQSSLREKQLLLADKMTSLGILVAGVAHEINNPATSLMLNAPNLKKAWEAFTPVLDNYYKKQTNELVCNMEYKELSKRIDMMLTSIEDSSARIKKIITELKDFSQPKDTDITEEIDINIMVEKSLDLTHTILKKATNNLSVNLDTSLPKISGNSQKLQQVIINLLVNACQALENKEQSIKITTSQSSKSGFVTIKVTDTGPGISPENLKKMKEPFFTTNRDDGGTGLGLSISEKIINDHKGIMEFTSVLGEGLTAVILLPLPDQTISGKKTGANANA